MHTRYVTAIITLADTPVLTFCAVFPGVAFHADAAPRDTLSLLAAVIGAGALPTVGACEALVTDALAVLAAALAVAVAWTP